MSENSFFQSNSKATFLTGLFLGIAVCSTIGLVLVFGMASKGTLAFAGPSTVAAAPQVPSVGDSDDSGLVPPQPPAGPVKPVDEKTDHILGSKNAKVTLIEYSDFECPFCQRFYPTVKELLKAYPNDVRFVYRHFPLNSIHPNAQKAAEASECAAKLGGNDAFFKLHDKIFDRSPDIGPAVLLSLAKEIGLKEADFKKCLDSGEMASKVNQQMQDGTGAGVSGTPATFVNGKLTSGAVPLESLKAAIDAELKK